MAIENIRKISNPLLRAITAGIFLGSLVTIPTALAVQMAKSPQDPHAESASKLVVYASLVSKIVGLAIGLSAGKRKDNELRLSDDTLARTNDLSQVESSTSTWKDWRRFIVMRKVKESDNITSFYLHPEDNGLIPEFMPGQFLTIKLDLPDRTELVTASNPNLHIIYRYSRPKTTDTGNYRDRGYIDTALIQNIVAPEMQKLCGSTEADYFLCGSPSFMDALRNGLREWGVPDRHVNFESFAKAMPKTAKSVRDLTIESNNDSRIERLRQREIVFTKSGKTLT